MNAFDAFAALTELSITNFAQHGGRPNHLSVSHHEDGRLLVLVDFSAGEMFGAAITEKQAGSPANGPLFYKYLLIAALTGSATYDYMRVNGTKPSFSDIAALVPANLMAVA